MAKASLEICMPVKAGDDMQDENEDEDEDGD
jgi:hypothetical protein